MSCWRKPDHHERSIGVTKAGDTLSPIVVVAIRRPFLASDLFSPLDESRTQATLLDVNFQLVQCIHSDNASFRRRMARKKTTSTNPPKMTTVLLVRHGQTPTTGKVLPGRAKNLHLGDVGIKQAERAAERIAALTKVSAVYASPMERTQETAAPIAKATGCRIRTRAGLNECDFGDWTGKKLSDLRKLPEWRTVQSYPSGFRFPKGESFPEMQARITGALTDLVAEHPGETIVAVSHADTIKAAVAQALGTHLDQFQRIVVSPCSISAIMYGQTGPIVLAVNSTGDDLTSLVPS